MAKQQVSVVSHGHRFLKTRSKHDIFQSCHFCRRQIASRNTVCNKLITKSVRACHQHNNLQTKDTQSDQSSVICSFYLANGTRTTILYLVLLSKFSNYHVFFLVMYNSQKVEHHYSFISEFSICKYCYHNLVQL